MWPALQIPEIYPPGTAEKTKDECVEEVTRARKLLDKHPGLTLEAKVKLLNKKGFSAEIKGCKIILGVYSKIAPELDNWFELNAGD